MGSVVLAMVPPCVFSGGGFTPTLTLPLKGEGTIAQIPSLG